MSDNKNAPLEFSAFDLMPAWAQEASEAKPAQKFKDQWQDDDRGPKGRRGDGGNFERRGGPRGGNERRQGGGDDRRGGGGGFRNDRGGGGDRRQGGDSRGNFEGRGGGGGDRRQGGGVGREGGERGGRGGNFRGGDRRGNFHHDQDENFEIKGLKLVFEPTPEAVKSLSKHIQESVKAYPVADLAKMVTNSRERYHIRLTSDKTGPSLYQIKGDGSAWLTRDEAIASFVRSPNLLGRYYVVEEVKLDPPKGNFGTIAVCGFSGEVLGPPNHHSYQGNIAKLHRERFSDMSLERYKSRIQMETGEEIIAKWHEKVSNAFHYRLVADMPEPVTPSEVKDEPSSLEAGPSESTEVAAETPGLDAATAAEPLVEEEVPAAEVTETPSEEAPRKPDGIVLKTTEELERHFRQNYAANEIIETREVILPGSVPGKKLAADLLSLLKSESKKLRRGFPFDMFQTLCGVLEKEGLKFFKRGKKSLHVSIVRPQAISESLILTDRIKKIIELVSGNQKIQTAELLTQLCPTFKNADPADKNSKAVLDDEARGILADIRWLAMEGYLVEFPDTHLEIGKRPNEDFDSRPSSKSSKKSAKKKDSRGPKLPGGVCTFTIFSPTLEKPKTFVANRPKPVPVVKNTEPTQIEVPTEPVQIESTVAVEVAAPSGTVIPPETTLETLES